MRREKFIDLREIIKDKNPGLIKLLPNFVLNFLRKTIHEDDINSVMDRHSDKMGLDFVNAFLTERNVQVNVIAEENIPLEESVIFASNHPLGGLDGIAFMEAIGRYRKDVKFLVNDLLMNVDNLRPLFVPINKVGSNPKAALQIIDQAYAADQALLVFPAGLVSRKINGKIADLEWKKSFVNKAKKYQKDIIPVYIDGTNSNFFYNFSKIRRKLGIKANLEMILLPKEMFGNRINQINIIFGKRISHTELDRSKTEQEWANRIKETVYQLKVTDKK